VVGVPGHAVGPNVDDGVGGDGGDDVGDLGDGDVVGDRAQPPSG
jgi:hypothetical protein